MRTVLRQRKQCQDEAPDNRNLQPSDYKGLEEGRDLPKWFVMLVVKMLNRHLEPPFAIRPLKSKVVGICLPADVQIVAPSLRSGPYEKRRRTPPGALIDSCPNSRSPWDRSWRAVHGGSRYAEARTLTSAVAAARLRRWFHLHLSTAYYETPGVWHKSQ